MRTHVVIPRELIDEIDQRVGPRRRSEFVTAALEEKLQRIRVLEAAREAAGSLADTVIPGWESSEAAAKWVRSLRAADERRVENLTEDA